MEHVDRRVVLAAIVHLAARVVIGIGVGIAQDLSFARIEAPINLAGSATCSVHAHVAVFGAMAWGSVLASEPNGSRAVAGLVAGPRGA
jgi:predicted membrane-bound spermidine synthase